MLSRTSGAGPRPKPAATRVEATSRTRPHPATGRMGGCGCPELHVKDLAFIAGNPDLPHPQNNSQFLAPAVLNSNRNTKTDPMDVVTIPTGNS